MKVLKTIALLIAIAAAFIGGYGYGRWYGKPAEGAAAKDGREILHYYCPMHPSYKSERPGDCPICGMRLVPVYAEEGPAAAPEAQAGRKVLYYRDPANPNYKAGNPGLNPETGNELEPVYAGEPSGLPEGVFKIPLEKQQLIGVRYGEVEMTSGTRTIRAVGKVEMDETRIARIHPKVDGWIETVQVDFIGRFVKKGQPLLTIYSPELLATQEEYLLAMKAKRIMGHSSLAAAHEDSNSLIAAARRRLELWDLTPAQIEELEKTQKPTKTVVLYSPLSGYVTARNAFPEQRVMPGTELYTIVDLSRVWVMADMFEYEAPSIRMGQTAQVSLSYYPGRTFAARVNYIQPSLDPATRTLKVRLEMDNPGLILKPEMFVDVEFRVHTPARLTVPVEAVLDSGLRKTVFVDHGNGYLEPRHVETGQYLEDRVEILKGLKPGERIVASGTFLIDSESRLKAAASGMPGHQHGAAGQESEPARERTQTPAPPAGAHQHD